MLSESGIEALDAQLLLAHTLGRSRSWLYAHDDEPISRDRSDTFQRLVAQRRQGEPVAYLVGQREFWSLPLRITPDVLIPRPETELLVELALASIDPIAKTTVLDLGTGSGAIALAIASQRHHAMVTAVDACPAALEVATNNAAQLAIDNLTLIESSWFDALADRRFDWIVSNPPYLAIDDPHLQLGDVANEPRAALIAGDDGLDALHEIISRAPYHLRTDGHLLVEHGNQQQTAVAELFADAGFSNIEQHADLAGQPRCVSGKLVLAARSKTQELSR